MKRCVTKSLNWLKRLLTAKKRIGRLGHVDIAIFDTHTADHLSKVLAGYTTFTIDTRGESIHIPILIFSILEFFRLRGTKKLSILYYSKIIKQLGAKICITNQDANAIFFDLARENDQVRFIALQQGLKQEATIGAFADICGDYFAFGAAYAEKLKNGKARMVIAGSLKGNNAQYDRGKNLRVAYISSFVGHAPNTKVLQTFNYAELSYPSIYGAVRIVDNFCSKNDIELIVVSKSFREQTESERAFILESERRLYSNVLDRTARVIAENSYVTAGESRLIISDQSALGYELLGAGCRVAFLNFTSYYAHAPSYRFGWPLTLPDRGPFWSCIPDPSYIEQMLQNIWCMSQDEWDEISRPYRDELMHYDKGNLILHKQLKAILDGSEDVAATAS